MPAVGLTAPGDVIDGVTDMLETVTGGLWPGGGGGGAGGGRGVGGGKDEDPRAERVRLWRQNVDPDGEFNAAGQQ